MSAEPTGEYRAGEREARGRGAPSARRGLIGAARRIYRAMPYRWMRRVLFNSFLRVVRRKHVRTRVDGLIFDLDLGELIDVLLFLGEYEPDVVGALERFCKNGWTVLDIGANVGAHSLRMARAVGSGGRVVAFEPTSYAHGKLVKNVALNSFENITLEKVALMEVNSEAASLRYRASWRTDGTDEKHEERIRTARLDDWCMANGVNRVDLIKLDVDGGEFGVLKGGERTIAEHLPVFVMEAGEYHFADDSRNPLRFLDSLGYRFSNAKTGSQYAGYRDILRDCVGVDSINVIASADDSRRQGRLRHA